MNPLPYELDAEEQELLTAFEKGELHALPNSAEKIRQAEEMARNTLAQLRVSEVNLKLSAQELFQIQNKATQEGISYETLLHIR